MEKAEKPWLMGENKDSGNEPDDAKENFLDLQSVLNWCSYLKSSSSTRLAATVQEQQQPWTLTTKAVRIRSTEQHRRCKLFSNIVWNTVIDYTNGNILIWNNLQIITEQLPAFSASLALVWTTARRRRRKTNMRALDISNNTIKMGTDISLIRTPICRFCKTHYTIYPRIT